MRDSDFRAAHFSPSLAQLVKIHPQGSRVRTSSPSSEKVPARPARNLQAFSPRVSLRATLSRDRKLSSLRCFGAQRGGVCSDPARTPTELGARKKPDPQAAPAAGAPSPAVPPPPPPTQPSNRPNPLRCPYTAPEACGLPSPPLPPRPTASLLHPPTSSSAGNPWGAPWPAACENPPPPLAATPCRHPLAAAPPSPRRQPRLLASPLPHRIPYRHSPRRQPSPPALAVASSPPSMP